MPPRDHRLTLLSKPGCHLCDDARAVLQRVATELGVPLDERDITVSESDFVEYGDRIPVTLLDGREHAFWRVARFACGRHWLARRRPGGVFPVSRARRISRR